jgi:hypothetical protein
MKPISAFPLLLVLAAALPAAAQEDSGALPRTEDVTSIDGIVHAFYDVVSGPAGEAPDRARDESLHLPGAVIMMVSRNAEGVPAYERFDLEEYHRRYGGVRMQPFYEWEETRETQQVGSLAHVWSRYALSTTPGGTPLRRGVTSMQLYHDGTRWWIAGWADHGEM